MKSYKVFIVDDDPDLSEGLAMILEMEGHRVEVAGSGEEALRRFRKGEFDLIFMDIRMPGMSGVESLSKIREIQADAKVIMMTAFSAEYWTEQAVEQGAENVLHKPFSGEAIVQALKQVLPAGRILIADDDPDHVEGVASILTIAGYCVVVARNGREAVDLALEVDIDVLLLDLRMPTINGLDVYAEIKKRGRAVPTVLVTGYRTEEAESIEMLRRLSVETCLTKPVAADDLLNAIERVI